MVEELFELSCGTQPDSAQARRLLARTQTFDLELRSRLRPLVDAFLADPRNAYDEYLSLAAVLRTLRFDDLLGKVMAAAKQSSDPALQDGRHALCLLDKTAAYHPNLVRAAIPELFDWACDDSDLATTARRIILTLPPGERRRLLQPLVDAFVVDPSRDSDEYRGAAALLADARLDELLALVLTSARNSSDVDVREVADGFT